MVRMYDPVIARFLQEDSYRGDINDPLSLNLYTYTHNEPLKHDDPTGHSITISAIVVGFAVGAAINTAVTAYKDYKDDGKFNSGAKTYIASGLQGGIEGAVGAAAGGLNLFGKAFASGTAALIGNAMGQKIKKGQVDWKEAGIDATVNFAIPIISNAAAKLIGKTKIDKVIKEKATAAKKAVVNKLSEIGENLFSPQMVDASTGMKIPFKPGSAKPDIIPETSVQKNFRETMAKIGNNADSSVREGLEQSSKGAAKTDTKTLNEWLKDTPDLLDETKQW
jgi:hypothetical protein